MNTPASRFFSFELNGQTCNIHYLEWGKPGKPVLVCAHGLTRNAHDFDYLANSLSDNWRVIAIDYPGRGHSDWLQDKSSYVIPIYAQVSQALFAHLCLDSVSWLGTSMGGLVGIVMAVLPGTPLNRLIINDVGPELAPVALKRISEYLALEFSFSDLDELEQYLRQIYAPFGNLSDPQWRHLAVHSHRMNKNGKLVFDYDPQISAPFRQTLDSEANLWPLWTSIKMPLYLIYGENSDILPGSIIEKMKQLQPGLDCCEIQGVGHAPALMDDEQIDQVRQWLES